MRLVNIEHVIPGMRLGEPIRGARGQMLLNRGAILTQAYVETLRSLEISAIYVADPDTTDVEVPCPISAETRARLLKNLAQIFDALSDATEKIRSSSINLLEQSPQRDAMLRDAAAMSGASEFLYSVSKEVDLLLEEMGKQDVLTGLNSIKTPEMYIFQHSIDVTIMALVLARRAQWERPRIRAFGIGCLLHDIGKVLIEPALLNRAGTLTPEQFERLKGHTAIGYEMMRIIAPRLGSLAPQVAYQHHERQDGSGYPRGLRGNSRLGENQPGTIHDFGALAAVADVYDAMTSHRPYRRALPTDEVVATIKAYAGDHLNAEAVRIFLSTVAPYPVCSPVVLVNGPHAGFSGVVVKVPPGDLAHPTVRLLCNDRGERIEALEVSLAIERDLNVRSAGGVAAQAHSLGSAPVTPQTPKSTYAIPAAVLEALKAG
jgi:HD-GYP domain-containing protein (c-di-GMP phosphodiesterase class II)